MKRLILFIILSIVFSVQAQKKISEYPNTATAAGTDLFILARPSTTTNYNIRYNQLASQIITNIATNLTAGYIPVVGLNLQLSNSVAQQSGTNWTVSGSITTGPYTNATVAGYANFQSSATGTNYFAGPILAGTNAFPADEYDGIYVNTPSITNNVGRAVKADSHYSGTYGSTGLEINSYIEGTNVQSHCNAVQSWLFCNNTNKIGYASSFYAAKTINSGTITNFYGYFYTPGTGGGVNNYAFYAAGTDPSLFCGKITVTTAILTDAQIIYPVFVNKPFASGIYGITSAQLGVFSDDTAAIGSGGAIALGGKSGLGSDPYANAFLLGARESLATYAGYFAIYTVSGGGGGETSSANYERLRVTSKGNVGIGITGPTNKLEVNGMTYHTNVTASGGDPVNGTLQWASGGEAQYRTSAANEGSGQINRYHNRAAQVVGVGTDYSLTQTKTNVTFGTSGGSIALPTAGTYQLHCLANFSSTTAADDLHFYLWDSTNNVVVPGSWQHHESHANNDHDVTPLTAIYTVTTNVHIWLGAVNVTAARGVIVSTNTILSYVRCY